MEKLTAKQDPAEHSRSKEPPKADAQLVSQTGVASSLYSRVVSSGGAMPQGI